MNKYQAIIFDYDGTLVDSISMLVNVFNFMSDNRGLPHLDMETIYSFNGPKIQDSIKRAYPNEDPEEIFKNEYLPEVNAHIKETNILFPYVVEMLEELTNKGYILAICTNKSHAAAKFAIDQVGIGKYFPILIAEDDVIHPKPDPEGILKFSKEYHIPLDNILYVGDNDNDYLTAKNAGIDVAIVKWCHKDNRKYLSKATYLIDSFKDFKEMF